MTTAHRATWKAARGGLQEEGSFRLHVPSAAVSSKDAPTERTLKLRPIADDCTSREELRARLESAEPPLQKRPRKSRFGPSFLAETEGAQTPGLGLEEELVDKACDRTDVCNNSLGREKRSVSEKETENMDDPRSKGALSSASESDSDDDEADLLAELENIRKEREYERAKKQSEEHERREEEERTITADGNPLLGRLSGLGDEISDTASIATSSVPAFAVRRRWDDDVIFHSDGRNERKNEPRFINDTIRNDYHHRFMKRHMR